MWFSKLPRTTHINTWARNSLKTSVECIDKCKSTYNLQSYDRQRASVLLDMVFSSDLGASCASARMKECDLGFILLPQLKRMRMRDNYCEAILREIKTSNTHAEQCTVSCYTYNTRTVAGIFEL